MATSLTFTSAGFMQGSTYSVSTSVNTKYDILSTDATYTRRIYGLSVTSTDAGAQTVKFHLHDGSQTFQIFTLNIPLSSGNIITAAAIDAFGSVYGASVFQKQRDANGVPYFNIPAGWKLQMEYNTALLAAEGLYVLVFGETYA
jgi:hypothetical protein